jgi:uncharacterized protein
MQFEWDPFKAAKVLAERGLDFRDAVELFDQDYVEIRSDQLNEVRWKLVGRLNDRMVTVIFVKRDDKVRIITMRRAWKSEEREFGALYR